MENRREEIGQARGGDMDTTVHSCQCPEEGIEEDFDQGLVVLVRLKHLIAFWTQVDLL